MFRKAGFEPLKKDCRIIIHPRLPNFVLKLARTKLGPQNPSRTCSVIERVLRADMMRGLIEELGLTRVSIPKKYLYHPKFLKKELLDRNFVCFAEKFDLLPLKENKHALWNLPEETVQEMITFIRAVGFLDIHEENVCVMPNKSIAYIDTEELTPWYEPQECVDWFNEFITPEKTQACIDNFVRFVNPRSLPID